MLAYISQMMLCSAILYGYYHLFLRNEKFHQYNRFYLLGAIIISLILPLIKIPVTVKDNDGVIYQSLDNFNETFVVVAQKEYQFTASALLYLLYGLMVLFFVVRIVISLVKIFKLRKNNPSEKLNDISFIQTSHPDTPFSFFKWLFWNRSISLNSDKGEQIFRHEMYHINKKHSFDLLFTELIAALFWFNPIFYFIKKEIKIIQEFLADRYATNEENVSSYAEILLMQTFGTHQHQLVNPFFHNQLKRRIAMLTKSKKPAYQYLRKLMVLPIVAVAITLFSFNYSKEINEIKEIVTKKIETVENAAPQQPAEKTITVIERKDTVPAKKKATSQQPFKFDTEKKTYLKLNPITVVTWSDENDVVTEPPKNRVDIFASYSGGADAWRNFIERNIRGDVPKNNGARPGNYEAAVRFTIEPDGSLSNFEPVTDEGYGMEEEIIRVLKKSDNWKPALNNKDGETRAVRSYWIQPVTFQVLKKDAQKVTENAAVELPQTFSEEVFTKVEKDASYPGGAGAWRNFLEKNLKGETPVDNGAPAGNYTTITQFIVDKNGNVSNIKSLTSLSYGMEAEAVRMVRLSGKWKPAIQNGREVTAYRKQPITFQIVEQ